MNLRPSGYEIDRNTQIVQQKQAFCDFMCQTCAIQLDANFIALRSQRFRHPDVTPSFTFGLDPCFLHDLMESLRKVSEPYIKRFADGQVAV